jgi:hypothetical protein
MIIVRLDRSRRRGALSANRLDSHVAGLKAEEKTPKHNVSRGEITPWSPNPSRMG